MLSVSDLSCVRGDQTLFSGVSFDLNAGQWLHLEGANGSGKTSLLRIVTGFTPPAHGQVCWKGRPLAEAPEAFHADLLYLGHALALKDELSALENLEADAAIAGRSFVHADALAALCAPTVNSYKRLASSPSASGTTHTSLPSMSRGRSARSASSPIFAARGSSLEQKMQGM